MTRRFSFTSNDNEDLHKDTTGGRRRRRNLTSTLIRISLKKALVLRLVATAAMVYCVVATGVLLRIPTVPLARDNDDYNNRETSPFLERDDKPQSSRLRRGRIMAATNPNNVHLGVVDQSDMEEIEHPALAYGITLPDDLPKTLLVPKFWNPPKYGGDVRDFLGNHGATLIAKDSALSIGSTSVTPSTKDGLETETIFVSIATYRDPDCVNTVESIYSRATHPHRIRTVVVEQRREGDSFCTRPEVPCQKDPSQILCKYHHLIHSFEFDARLAVGPTFARHIGHRHYRGEFFAMQVDSHVRFTQRWDEDIIDQFKAANNEMAVLSTYLLDLNGAIDQETYQSKRTDRALLCNAYFENGVLHNGLQYARPVPVSLKGTPTLHPFWAAGFSFARGHFAVQVPYDQHLPMVFQGEEISMAVRAFSYGYDFYAPERSVCFHMYAVHKNRENRLAVPTFTENQHLFAGVDVESMKRLTCIIQLKGKEDLDQCNTSTGLLLGDTEKYGIGKVRSPQIFYRTFGIHSDTQTVEDNLCWFAGENMHLRFIPHMRDDRMGIDYEKVNYEFKDPARAKK
jgi:[Skp1-protein]-hydroxyproline N-acetylglucosaminyltransferase